MTTSPATGTIRAHSGGLERLRGWVEAAHPWPAAVVVSLSLVIGAASAEAAPSWWRLALLTFAMLGNQLAIGWSNDYLDRESDAHHQAWKPLPAGRIRASELAFGTVAALIVSLACGALLGWASLLLLVGGSAAGFAYNLWLKDSRLSWLPYVLAFALLPPFAWMALDVFRDDLLWLYPVALPLAVVAHLANALSDIETDAAAGRRSVVVALGRGRVLVLIAAGLALPLLLLVASLPFLGYEPLILLAGLVLYGAFTLGAAVAYARDADRQAFRFLSLAALAFVGGSIAAL
jgi:4-hydroxybenzoate polyprenyltransferase